MPEYETAEVHKGYPRALWPPSPQGFSTFWTVGPADIFFKIFGPANFFQEIANILVQAFVLTSWSKKFFTAFSAFFSV